MRQQRQWSSSPTKKSQFRSKPLPAPVKSIPSYSLYVKEFPLTTPEDIFRIIHSLEPIHSQFAQNLSNLRLYKSQLATQFEANWHDILESIKQIIMKLIRRGDRMVEQKQAQVAHLLNLNSAAEKQVQKLKDRIDSLQHLRQIQRAELDAANSEVESANKEMSDVYNIVKSDMKRILKYLTEVEETKLKETNENNNKIYSSLDSFNVVISSIENEHRNTTNTLSTMREMIKAMARSTKTTTATQVDESELQTKVANIFVSGQQKHSFDTMDATSLNIVNAQEYGHIIDKLKLKQKQTAHQVYNPKKNIEKPWALTPTLLAFLENMSKENEAGRVVPWEYMKALINQIYEERVKSEQEMVSGMVGNSMLFDQFVVFYFLKRYRIRRLAQVKLLEFIISLKYYAKFWRKAETFCVVMDVMKYIPMFDQGDAYNYKIDYYAQNYFFQVWRILNSFELINDDDGAVYIPIKKVKKIMKAVLFFTDDLSKSRLMSRLDKDIRVFNKAECTDFDYSMMLFMEQYFTVRRRNAGQLIRSFSRVTQKIDGFFSIDEMLNIFSEFSKLYSAGQQFSQKFPIESQLQIAKLYLYAITSGKNNYEITSGNFLQACQRFGFDSPFPFLHSCAKYKQKKEEPSQETEQNKQKTVDPETVQKQDQQQASPEQADRLKLTPDTTELRYINLNQQRVDIAARLFSQHYSIIKELRDYVTAFSDSMEKETDTQIVWKSFRQIRAILEKGCAFMKYPLLVKS